MSTTQTEILAESPGYYFNQKKEIMPSWLWKNNYEVTLDKYYTYPKYAEYCYKSLLKVAKKHNIDVSKYTFLEPSAGNGAFYDLLPKNSIGIDLMPERRVLLKRTFLIGSLKRIRNI